MGNQETNSVEEELQSLDERGLRENVIGRATVGVESSYSENYGVLDFSYESGFNDSPVYTVGFGDVTELSFEHQVGKGADKLIYVLEALTREIPIDKAIDEIYISGTERDEDLEPVLNSDQVLEEKYRDDLSRLLEEEFWKEEEEGEEYGFQVS